MYDSRSISLTTVILFCLWSWVLISLSVGWCLACVGEQSTALMFGLTSCVSAAVATTATCRSYAVRVAILVRNLHGVEDRGSGLHTVP